MVFLVRVRIGARGASIVGSGFSVALDHAGATSALRFISHAHSDHIFDLRAGQKAVCSEPTEILAALRGKFFTKVQLDSAELVPTGHILGSSALYIHDEFLYTGDFNDRDREFSDGFRPPRAKVVVTEATYGVEKFVFDSEQDVISEAADRITDLLRKDKCAIITGYPLGKSQHLQMMFDPYFHGVASYSWPSIETYNDIYRLFGEKISRKKEIAAGVEAELLDGRSPKVVYMPSYAKRLPLYAEMRRKGAVSFGFSGWSLMGQYSEAVDVDQAFPISDHADFNGLMRTVERAEPEKVYVTHGFTKELAKALRGRGIDASPLSGARGRLSFFLD